MYILKLIVILHLLIPLQIEAERRIFAGKEVTSTKDMPFIVSLKIYMGPPTEESTPFGCCAGTYIRPLWVLTATHCIAAQQFPKEGHKPLYDIELCMGAIEPAKCPEKDKRLAEAFYPHTPGSPAFEEHDVCLLSVAKPWALRSTIQIAKLPTEKVDKETYHNMRCTVGGWGSFDLTGVAANILKQAAVKCFIGDHDKCPVEKGKRGERQICVIGESGIPCEGDSGGPLFCQGVVIGLAIMVMGKGGEEGYCNTTTEKTTVYNMIQEYNDWILSVAGGGGSRIVPNYLCLSVIYATLYFK